MLYGLIGLWFAIMAAIAIVERAAGISPTLAMVMVTLLVYGIPPVVIVSLFGPGDTTTVPEMTYQ